jgi:hypothetical protein
MAKKEKETKSEGTTLALTVRERLLISQLYPREASLTDQTIVRDITRKVEISQAEQKKIGLKPMTQGFTWDDKKEKVLQAELTETELNLLKDRVEQLDKEKKITQQLVELCLKIKHA